MKRLITIIILLLVGVFLLHAQVTIGSGEKPIEGALLQLKNITGVTDGSANATKGLGLPRVMLSNRFDLYPLSDDTSTDANTMIGTIVYNMRENDTQQNRICKGVHVWTGNEWHPIRSYPVHPATVILSEEDKRSTIIEKHDQIEYKTVWLSSDNSEAINVNQFSCDPNAVPTPGTEIIGGGYAAWWLAEDLYHTKAQNGVPLAPTIGNNVLSTWPLSINPAYQSVGTAATPNLAITYRTINDLKNNTTIINYKEDGVEIALTPYQYAQKFGSKYLFDQAMRSCPQGWYVPTIEDLDELMAFYLEGTGVNTSGLDLSTKLSHSGRYLKGKNINYTSQDGVETGKWNPTLESEHGKIKPYEKGFNALPGGHTQPLVFANYATDPKVGSNFSGSIGWWLSTVGASFNLSRYNSTTQNDVGGVILGRDTGYEGLALAMRCIKKNVATGIEFVYDKEGTPYMAASFGSAGVWMVQNLRTKVKPNGTELAYGSDYVYPGGDVIMSPPTNVYLRVSHGFQYTWAAATNGSTATTDQGYGTADADKYIQGICPDGWHLPTDKEWSLLEKELYEKTHLYTTASTPMGTWSDADYTSQTGGSRTGLGIAFLSSKNEVDQLNSTPTNGISLPAERGGFDAQALSYNGAYQNGYGYFWSCSSQDVTNAWPRDLHMASKVMRRIPHAKTNFFSVRCKKN